MSFFAEFGSSIQYVITLAQLVLLGVLILVGVLLVQQLPKLLRRQNSVVLPKEAEPTIRKESMVHELRKASRRIWELQATENEDIPDGWEKGITPSGHIYWIDHSSKRTTWTDPRSKISPCFRGQDLPEADPPPSFPPSTSSSPMCELSPDESESRQRHKHRSCSGPRSSPDVIDSSKKKTKKHRHVRHSDEEIRDRLKRGPFDPKDGKGLLPPGWEKAQTDAGFPFFINHFSKTTTWVDPRTEKTNMGTQTAMLFKRYKEELEKKFETEHFVELQRLDPIVGEAFIASVV